MSDPFAKLDEMMGSNVDPFKKLDKFTPIPAPVSSTPPLTEEETYRLMDAGVPPEKIGRVRMPQPGLEGEVYSPNDVEIAGEKFNMVDILKDALLGGIQLPEIGLIKKVISGLGAKAVEKTGATKGWLTKPGGIVPQSLSQTERGVELAGRELGAKLDEVIAPTQSKYLHSDDIGYFSDLDTKVKQVAKEFEVPLNLFSPKKRPSLDATFGTAYLDKGEIGVTIRGKRGDQWAKERLSDEQIISTTAHELAHLKTGVNHGEGFKELKRRIEERLKELGSKAPVVEEKVAPITLKELNIPPNTPKAPPISPGMDKVDFDFLKATETPPPRGKADKPGLVRQAWDELNRLIGDPYSKQNLFKYPAGEQMWKSLDLAKREEAKFMIKSVAERKANIRIKPETPESDAVGAMLDQYQSFEEIPAYLQSMMTTDEKNAFKFYRQKWDERADQLVKMGLMDPTKRVKSYLFRIFDKETIYQGWKDELDALMIAKAKSGIDYKETVRMKDVEAKLRKSIETYEKTGTILYDYVPKSIEVPFLKERKGVGGYSFDAVKAFDIYEALFAKKMFLEPALKQSVALMKEIPDYGMRNYARWQLRDRILGMGEKYPALRSLTRVATNLEYMKTMGFNLRSAATNATQTLNTLVEIGPKWTAEGAYRAMFDPKTKQVLDEMGIATELPGLYYGQTAKIFEKANEAAFYLFNKVELANRYTAAAGAYHKGLAQGMGEAAARQYALDVERSTQFIYGPLGMPKLFDIPVIGPVAGQFTTFSAKQAQLFMDWAKNNPKKLVQYLVIAGGVQEGFRQLGVDLSNAIGIGVDHRELISALYDLGQGKFKAAHLHTKLGLPYLPFINEGGRKGAGIAPSGLAPLIKEVQDLASGEFRKVMTPVAVERGIQTVGALVEGEGEKGYPVRDTEGYLQTRETLPQVLGRNVVKPMIESKVQIEAQRERLIRESKSEAFTRAVKAAGRGDFNTANEYMTKYGIQFDSGDLRKEYFKRNFTQAERMKIEEWKSQQELIYKYKIGEFPGEMP